MDKDGIEEVGGETETVAPEPSDERGGEGDGELILGESELHGVKASGEIEEDEEKCAGGDGVADIRIRRGRMAEEKAARRRRRRDEEHTRGARQSCDFYSAAGRRRVREGEGDDKLLSDRVR